MLSILCLCILGGLMLAWPVVDFLRRNNLI